MNFIRGPRPQSEVINLEQPNPMYEWCLPVDISNSVEELFQKRLCTRGKKKFTQDFVLSVGAKTTTLRVLGSDTNVLEENSTWVGLFPPNPQSHKIYRKEIVCKRIVQESSGLVAVKSEHGTTFKPDDLNRER